MKPEPSELVFRGPPPFSPRRFLKKSSKNSSNGEPGGSCGAAPPLLSPEPLASTVWVVEMLTTASITFSATSAIPSGPRAEAGAGPAITAAPRHSAASSGLIRKGLIRELKAIAAGMVESSPGVRERKRSRVNTAPDPGTGASIGGERSYPIRRTDCGENQRQTRCRG